MTCAPRLSHTNPIFLYDAELLFSLGLEFSILYGLIIIKLSQKGNKLMRRATLLMALHCNAL